MAYDRDDRFRGSNDRWRDRNSRPNETSPYGERDLGRGYGTSHNRDDDRRWRGDWDRDDDERGFFERAGERVRSWFGDDDDDRGRDFRGERAGAGWGNQRGWSDDRHERYGDFTSAGGGGDRFGEDIGGGRSNEVFGGPGFGGTSGFGGGPDHGRRFDRIDAGSTGTQGVHPMSSPVGGAYGSGYGISSGGGFGSSSARYGGQSRGTTSQSGSGFRDRPSFGGGVHDPNYAEWRRRQIDELDRDYDDYRREHQSKFEQEFGGWREKRQGQRRSMSRVTEKMEVIGSDGQHIGTVDKVRGDRIILTKNDENAGGIHHSIPCGWIDSVDDKVKVNKSAQEAMSAWRDEERNRALFEREDQGRGGPHVLNRSFSGTYSDDE